ncbi:hypothetical protein M446_6284 [Methylobacterium sp. 4-46]|nr:hypothetical protein M446_6284 [Methylobacterium sp. 4-46]
MATALLAFAATPALVVALAYAAVRMQERELARVRRDLSLRTVRLARARRAS